MPRARDILDPAVPFVAPDLPVADLAKLLHQRRADGACVVVEDRRLLGVVTNMDLVFQEKQVHLPTVLFFLDAVLEFGTRRTRQELEKIVGSTVADIMTTDVVSATPDTDLSEIATWMVEKHLSVVPVLEDGHILGAVTRMSILTAI